MICPPREAAYKLWRFERLERSESEAKINTIELLLPTYKLHNYISALLSRHFSFAFLKYIRYCPS